MSPKFVLLSLGSNLGNRSSNIEQAFELLSKSGTLKVPCLSKIYETEPVGFKEQPDFLNAVCSGYTDLAINEFFLFCKKIETDIGRTSRERWHEREIDIDILLYEDFISDNEKLSIPHKRMHERKFVLIPASEIAGNRIHPVTGLTINELLKVCKDESDVELYQR